MVAPRAPGTGHIRGKRAPTRGAPTGAGGAAPRWIENEYGAPAVLIGRNRHSVQNEAVIFLCERFGRLTAAPVPDPPDMESER